MGSFSIKAALVKHTPQGNTLIHFSKVLVPSQGSQSQKAELIRELMREFPSHSEAAIVTALGGSGAVLRSISLPKMSRQELKGALSFEAEKYIPFKVEESRLDFEILGDRPGGRMEVLLAAAKMESVDDHLELMKLADLAPDVVDLEALALANAWEAGQLVSKEAATGAVVLVHVGARGTILVFVVGTQLQFVREIPIGGDAFTRTLAEALQLDAVEAEKIKCQLGERVSDLKNALQPQWEEWLAQCRVSFDFYENQFGQRIEKLVLSGGSAELVGFKDWVLESMALPLGEWKTPSAPSGNPPGLEYHVAMGLALREK